MFNKLSVSLLLMVIAIMSGGCAKPRWDSSKSVEAPSYVRFHDQGELDRLKVTKITPHNGVQFSKIDGKPFGKIVYSNRGGSIIELIPGQHGLELFNYDVSKSLSMSGKLTEYG